MNIILRCLPTTSPSNFIILETSSFNKDYTWNQRIENLQ